MNSCFFNPNLGKSSRSLSSPGGLGRAQLLSVAGGYLPLGRAQDRRMSPELLAKVTRAWGLRTEFGSPHGSAVCPLEASLSSSLGESTCSHST